MLNEKSMILFKKNVSWHSLFKPTNLVVKCRYVVLKKCHWMYVCPPQSFMKPSIQAKKLGWKMSLYCGTPMV
jgi:hypothetical protein